MIPIDLCCAVAEFVETNIEIYLFPLRYLSAVHYGNVASGEANDDGLPASRLILGRVIITELYSRLPNVGMITDNEIVVCHRLYHRTKRMNWKADQYSYQIIIIDWHSTIIHYAHQYRMAENVMGGRAWIMLLAMECCSITKSKHSRKFWKFRHHLSDFFIGILHERFSQQYVNGHRLGGHYLLYLG